MEPPIGVKIFPAGTMFCPVCEGKMVLDYTQEVVELTSGKEYTKREWYIKCGTTNCPRQNVHVSLPTVGG